MANWTAEVAAAFHAIARGFGRRTKVKSTLFDDTNGRLPFNASGVAQVGPGRFVFIDNHDPSALFELALSADGKQVERISRRPTPGVAEGQLRDPEGLTRVDHNGEVLLVVASSLSVVDGKRSDGLVRVRYRPHGDLQIGSNARIPRLVTAPGADRSTQPATGNRTPAGSTSKASPGTRAPGRSCSASGRPRTPEASP